MNLYVGVTDKDWFRFLGERPGIDEVNFWQPSGSRQFRAVQPGDPFHRLQKDIDNGEQCYRIEGCAIWLPKCQEDRPNREFLEWHADAVPLG